MPEDKTYNILFITNNNLTGIKELLPQICRPLTKQCHEIHIIYPKNIDENYARMLREIPWIHVYPVSVEDKILSLSNCGLPLKIIEYIKKYDGMDVIHSFGVSSNILAALAGFYLKIPVINSPDTPVKTNASRGFIGMLQKFAKDNINYLATRIVKKIIYNSSQQQEELAKNISYKNINSEVLSLTDKPEEISSNLLKIYGSI